jgi:DNA/RNA endonuclease YhcR with UshA esterase domain
MKRFKLLLLMALLVGLVSMAYSQETISPEDAAKYIGQQKTVSGTVASAHYAAIIKKQPTSLHLNKPYPNQIFSVLIWGSDRGKFEKPPETLYSGKEICVTGMIQSYQGRPEIIVKDPGQIRVKR